MMNLWVIFSYTSAWSSKNDLLFQAAATWRYCKMNLKSFTASGRMQHSQFPLACLLSSPSLPPCLLLLLFFLSSSVLSLSPCLPFSLSLPLPSYSLPPSSPCICVFHCCTQGKGPGTQETCFLSWLFPGPCHWAVASCLPQANPKGPPSSWQGPHFPLVRLGWLAGGRVGHWGMERMRWQDFFFFFFAFHSTKSLTPSLAS